MPPADLLDLSRRERQVLDIVYRLQVATASDVQQELADGSRYSAVRSVLSTLQKKRLLKVSRDGIRYEYRPTITAETARRTVTQHLVETFFGGSLSLAVSSLLDHGEDALTEQERRDLRRKLLKAREDGR
jgi:BlaI family transcriptional regulator, penicillinase repressor